jgi:hypothetical protein
MSEQSFEYARGRFINPSRIIEVSVYKKDVPGKENPSAYETVYRIALTLDVQQADKSVVYSDAYASEADALAYARAVPLK